MATLMVLEPPKDRDDCQLKYGVCLPHRRRQSPDLYKTLWQFSIGGSGTFTPHVRLYKRSSDDPDPSGKDVA
jgi:hypothetical protein